MQTQRIEFAVETKKRYSTEGGQVNIITAENQFQGRGDKLV